MHIEANLAHLHVVNKTVQSWRSKTFNTFTHLLQNKAKSKAAEESKNTKREGYIPPYYYAIDESFTGTYV